MDARNRSDDRSTDSLSNPNRTANDSSHSLDRLEPETVLDLYLDERKTDLAERTRRSHRYVIETFVEWCSKNDVTALADIDGRDLHEYRISRRDDVNGNTLRSQLGVIRVFMRFAESIEAARPGVAERIRLPEVERQARDTRLEETVADVILDLLD